MNTFSKFFQSSLGRKYIMALSGLFLALFLVEHLYGNVLLYKNDGGQAFIDYSHTMVHNLLIRIVEVFLFAAIIIHVVQAIQLTRLNNKARPIKYAVTKAGQTSNWFSRNMGLTGSLIFFFIVVHLKTFFVPYRIVGFEEGQNVALSVKQAFESGWYSLFYVLAVVLLGFHLNHGFQSAFKSLGLSNKKYAPLLKGASTGFAIFIILGFASFPILFYFGIVGKSF